MKTKLFSLSLLLALAFIGCKKDDSSSPSSSDAVITYNDGADVSVDSAKAVLYTLGVAPFNREIDIYAYKGGFQVLEFHFLPKSGAQTVGLSFNDAWLTYLINNGAAFPDDYFNCTSGNFNLSECDTVGDKIKGTFDFIGNNGTTNKTISSGTINITSITRQ